MLETINEQVYNLISLYEKEKKKCGELQVKIEALNNLINEQNKQISELKDENEKIRLKTAFVGVQRDKEGAKRDLDNLIKEIDRCISLL